MLCAFFEEIYYLFRVVVVDVSLSKEKKIGIICGMISPKTYLHSPYAVFQNAKPFVYETCVELIKSLE